MHFKKVPLILIVRRILFLFSIPFACGVFLLTPATTAFTVSDPNFLATPEANNQAFFVLSEEETTTTTMETTTTTIVGTETTTTEPPVTTTETPTTIPPPVEPPPTTIAPPPPPIGVLAVMQASTQIGVPYRWGAVNPNRGFDCSGLVLWAYRSVGISSLPRTSRGMRVATRRITQGELIPGDLVFYGRRRIHHVTMYVGQGMVIAAPHRGSRVQFQPLRLSGGVSFGRIREA